MHRKLLSALFLTLLTFTCLQAQSGSPEQAPAATFSSTTRLVMVDVVVKGKKDGSFPELTQGDFEVKEDGKPQKVSIFTKAENTSQPAVPGSSDEPGTWTNVNAQDATGPATIILLDMLNTPSNDRANVRRGMLSYVAGSLNRAPNIPIAVFGLGYRLVLLQDFTTDSKLLTQAIDTYTSNPREPSSQGRDSADVQSAMAQLPNDDLFKPAMAETADAISRFEMASDTQLAVDRTLATGQFLRTIARASHRVQGRKSLLWLSAGFPLFFSAEGRLGDYINDVKKTVNALSDAQISVYPVDVRGLMVYRDLPGPQIQTRQNVAGRGEVAALDALRNMQDQATTPQESMKEIADSTGGRYYVNQNDVGNAIVQAVDDQKHYYTIGYYPENKKWNGNYRKIDVKVNRPDVEVRYRKGYFGDPTPTLTEKDTNVALQTDPFSSNDVRFFAHFNYQPTGGRVKTDVQFFVPGPAVSFENLNGKFTANLEFYALVFGKDGKIVSSDHRAAKVELNQEKFDKAQKSGLMNALKVDAGPGDRVRVAVVDKTTGKLGSMVIPMKSGS
jgi:VWFA-related protein